MALGVGVAEGEARGWSGGQKCGQQHQLSQVPGAMPAALLLGPVQGLTLS